MKTHVSSIFDAESYTAFEFEDAVRRDAYLFRPRLYSSFIAPNKELVNWIEKTECWPFVDEMYHGAFLYGAAYMFNELNSKFSLFENE